MRGGGHPAPPHPFLLQICVYFVLASFFWMGGEGVNIYLCVIKVIHGKISKFMWKAGAVAWGKSVYLTFYCVFLLINQTDNLDNYHRCDWVFPR